MNTLIKLFISFFKVSLFSFGGAYAQIPLYERELVNLNNWLTPDEFLIVTGSSQAIPGAISIKIASYAGYKVAGVPGAIISIAAGIFVPATLVIILFKILDLIKQIPITTKLLNGITYGTWGMIIGFGIQSLVKTKITVSNIIIGLTALILIAFVNLNPILVVIISALLGLLLCAL